LNKPQKALCGGIPGDGFGIWGRFWSHFVGNCCQKLTNLSRIDFEIHSLQMGSASPKCRPQKIPPCSLFCGRACPWAVLVEIKDLKDLKRVPPKCRASRRNAAPTFLRATVKSRENKCRCHVGSPSGLQVWGIQPRSVSFFNTATPPPPHLPLLSPSLPLFTSLCRKTTPECWRR